LSACGIDRSIELEDISLFQDAWKKQTSVTVLYCDNIINTF